MHNPIKLNRTIEFQNSNRQKSSNGVATAYSPSMHLKAYQYRECCYTQFWLFHDQTLLPKTKVNKFEYLFIISSMYKPNNAK